MPVLIERSSYFILDLQTAPLPCRGGLSKGDRLRKEERQRLLGRRTSGSRRAGQQCVDTLASGLDPPALARGPTDRKGGYPPILERPFGSPLAPHPYPAKEDGH